MRLAFSCCKLRHVRRQLERCGDCAPGQQCANHLACATQRDAALAAEIGAAWAVFVRGQLDIRRPWPPFERRVAAIALRLVEGLAASASGYDGRTALYSSAWASNDVRRASSSCDIGRV